MEPLLYKIARDKDKGSREGLPGSTELLRLMEGRLQNCQALADSLMNCHLAYVRMDLDGIMQAVDAQSALCEEITRADARILKLRVQQSADAAPGPEASRAGELERSTLECRHTISLLNRKYASLVRKAAHNNAVLRHLYANALVYADPRADIAADGLRLAKEEHYG